MQHRANWSAAPLRRLTPREIEVLQHTATGRANADIASDLGITVHGVKFHLASIFRKLGVHNRTEATASYLSLSANDGTEPLG
jgi:DNA-binding CsgD family transcriptional regulator